jgi:hypothetical protein
MTHHSAAHAASKENVGDLPAHSWPQTHAYDHALTMAFKSTTTRT